jgi:Bifunctional DNA primase/polymerase, N-terminal
MAGRCKVSTDEWRELLGHDVLLLPWPLGSKGTKKKWGRLTIASMTPKYLKKLERGNIGVALGAKSDNLIALDVDADEMIEPFLAANPYLKGTLQTHGARGRVFWLRMAGEYPGVTKKLKTRSGGNAGEWRAGKNSQSIIHGIHPDTGKPYQILNHVKPLVVDFAKIVWPVEISNPPTLETQSLADDTERQSDREPERQSHGVTDDTDDTKAVVCESLVSKALPPLPKPICQTVDEAVQLALPTKNHQNNDRLFVLARAVLTLEGQSGKFTPKLLRDVFSRWFNGAKAFLRPELTRDEYMTQFLNAYASAKIPLGEGSITQAWKQALEKPLPPEAIENFEDLNLRRVVALCRELQIMAGHAPFYLSARTVARLTNQEGHATAARWLRSLRVLKILDEVEKGSGLKASRYRYRGKIQSPTERPTL